jgi:copper chaperone
MSCGHCVAAVRTALQDLPGVSVENVIIGAADIDADLELASMEAIVDAIADAGYDATVQSARR